MGVFKDTMILPFQNYLDSRKVKRKTPDPEEAGVLLTQAQDRLDFIQNNIMH